jgi:hypothetical protein
MDDLNVANGTNPHIDQDKVHFRKSSKSNFSGNCVEVAIKGSSVLVRDSKNPGTEMQFTPGLWAAFTDFVRKQNL